MLSDFAEKKQTFEYKYTIFHRPKNRIFPKGLHMLLTKKCQFFSLFRFGQDKTRNSAYGL